MPKLTLMLDGIFIRDYELNEDEITVGRRTINTITTDNSDLAVSGIHGSIVTILDEHFIEDLDSTNGTYVNGKPIRKHNLKDGDVIAFGRHTLKYVIDNSHLSASGKETDPHDESYDPTMLEAQTNQTDLQAEEASTTAPFLKILTGSNSGKELKIIKQLTTIGKPGEQVGVITQRDKQYYFLHVETRGDFSPPLLNDTALEEDSPALKPQDILEIAGIKLEFFQASH